jgi:hypothetical protein
MWNNNGNSKGNSNKNRKDSIINSINNNNQDWRSWLLDLGQQVLHGLQ